ncbi:1-acyl-sn-glycerol-3-phosphate acyltransferase [Gammaproteobacteria bacterium]|nr:1-acyl-sn-glycerol-3-phosphate acyltransferase [Gammaproteobacteria bacterium]
MIRFLLWLFGSLLSYGIVCFLLTLVYALTHSHQVHRWMWAIYTYWIKQLCACAKVHLPNIHVQTDISAVKAPYLIIANHYSWLDILIIYMVMTPRAPSFVFVMKRSLIKIPMIGIICWGLGHPMVRKRKRRINGQLENHYILQSAAKEARLHQYGMMIFPEGTRYNIYNELPKTQYQYLLNPKKSGLKILLEELQPKSIIDITLSYERHQHKIIDFLLGRIGGVSVHIEQLDPNPQEITSWLRNRWQLKDLRLDQMQYPHPESH